MFGCEVVVLPLCLEIGALFVGILELKTRECLCAAFLKTKLNGSDGLKR